MFEPKKFSVAPKRTIALGNSEHPVLKYTVGDSFKRIPTDDKIYANLFYLELKGNKGMVTFQDCHSYPSLQFHKLTLAEMKAKVESKESFNSQYEVVNIDPKNKYIGNDVMQLIEDEEVFKKQMSDIDFMFLMNKFMKHNGVNTRKAIMYIAPVIVARHMVELSDAALEVYVEKVRPIIIGFTKNGFDGRGMPSSQSIVNDADHVTKWLDSHQVEGIQIMYTKTKFIGLFGVDL